METILVTFLAPFLPYLLKAGESAATAAAQALGEGAWKRASSVWKKLWPRVEPKEAAREAVTDLAGRPDDQRARGALELQLEKILGADKDLGEELRKILEDGQRAGVIARDGGVVIGGDVRADRGGIAAGHDIRVDGSGGIRTGWTPPDQNG